MTIVGLAPPGTPVYETAPRYLVVAGASPRCTGPLEVTANGRRGSRVSWELIPLDWPTTVDD